MEAVRCQTNFRSTHLATTARARPCRISFLYLLTPTWTLLERNSRFRDNPLVTSEPRIRFYAGTPLVNEDGFALGTLCVVDREPRKLDDEQKEALKSLGRLALRQMELRKNLQMLKEALNDRTREEHARELEIKRLEEKLIRVLGLKI